MCRKGHTSDEKLIMSACKIIVSNLFSQDAVWEIEASSLKQYSKLTYWWHARLTKEVLCNILKNKFLCRLMSQQISPINVMIQHCKICKWWWHLRKRFFCSKELPTISKCQGKFSSLSSYLETQVLSWKNWVGVCTDASLSVVDSVSFASL